MRFTFFPQELIYRRTLHETEKQLRYGNIVIYLFIDGGIKKKKIKKKRDSVRNMHNKFN